MRLTRLKADPGGTLAVRGDKEGYPDKMSRREGVLGIENKNTYNTQLHLNKQKIGKP